MPTRFEDMKRASRVINVCVKHGLGYFVQLYGLQWHLHFFNRILLSKKQAPTSLPKRVRAAIEELGGGYIKLGQLLSVRPDLIPQEYCEEFKRLRDETTPLRFADVKKTIETELGQPLKKLFSRVDKNPLGAASVAQVHRAQLFSSKHVVIKVQRPNIQQQFAEDLDILYYLAHKIERHLDIKNYSPLAIVQEFERFTKNELNFVVEARTIEQFYQNFRDSPTIRIPKVHWTLTTPRLLVMDYLDGKKLSDMKHLTPPARTLIANRIMDCALKQLFEFGIFHADMHPGNILILPDNKIGLIDFGITGKINPERTRQLIDAYIGIMHQNSEQVIQSLLSLGPVSPTTNIDAFRDDVTQLLDQWFGVSPLKIRVTQLTFMLFETCLKHSIQIPKDLILFGKTAMTVEGTCIEISPDFNFVAYSTPKIAALLRKQHAPKKMVNDFLKKSLSLGQNITALPGAAVSLMTKLEHEPLRISVNTTDVRHLGSDINTSSNRLAYSMLIASFIIAGSLLINTGPAYSNYSVISITSFLIAGMLFFPLVVSVLHEGNKRYDQHDN